MENLKVANVILGYGKAKPIIERHLELWKSTCDILVFVMPEDACYTVPNHYTLIHDKSSHHGTGIIKRTMFAFKKALEINADIFCFMEYDAVMLKRPDISEDRQVQVNVAGWNDPTYSEEGYFFKAKFFCHTPFIFTRKALEHFCTVMDEEPFEIGYPCRWFGGQLDKHNIPIFDLLGNGEGFTQNTIDNPDILIKHLKEGRYAIHGIKSDEVYNALENFKLKNP